MTKQVRKYRVLKRVPIVEAALDRVEPALVFLPAAAREAVRRTFRSCLAGRPVSAAEAQKVAELTAALALFFHREVPEEDEGARAEGQKAHFVAFAARYGAPPPDETFYSGTLAERRAALAVYVHGVEKRARSLYRQEVRGIRDIAAEVEGTEVATEVPREFFCLPMFKTRFLEAFGELYFPSSRKEVR